MADARQRVAPIPSPPRSGDRYVNVLLIDDHPLFREGLSLLLQPLRTDLVTQQAGSVEEGLDRLQTGPAADLVLIDLGLPGMNGLDGIALLRQRYPELPVVALSSADDRDTVLRAIDAGAMGFIPKSSTSAVLMAALQLILARGIYLPPVAFLGAPGVAAAAPAAPERVDPAGLGLSPRQCDVLYLILQGKPAKLIERELGLSASTVKVHTSAVLRALNVTTRTQAVVAAGRLGLRF
jgi:DNA-binding NarL/FixJ family response regulator